MMEKEFTISVFTENQTGVLSRVISTFTKRHINIESINVSPSSSPNIHRYTIVVNVSETSVKKLVAQIEKQIDILKAFYYHSDELVYQELAMYKVPISGLYNSSSVEELIRKHNARILAIEPEFIIIEKTGLTHETEALLSDLRPLGIYEFSRSGRVAIVKPMEQLNTYLQSIKSKISY